MESLPKFWSVGERHLKNFITLTVSPPQRRTTLFHHNRHHEVGVVFLLRSLDDVRQKLHDFKALAFEVLGNWAPDLVGRMIGAREPL
jgi:hypothetical protein